MENIELYMVTIMPDYLRYLHSIDHRVSVKYNNRPFVGIITMINGIKYVLPLTSITTGKLKERGKKKRSTRITTFIRDREDSEIANLLHNNMIPVTDNVYSLCEIDTSLNNNSFEANEIRYIRKNKEKIIKKAKRVHDERILLNDQFLIRTCCDFQKLEKEFQKFKKNDV